MPQISAPIAPAASSIPTTRGGDATLANDDSASNQPFDGVLQNRLGKGEAAKPLREADAPPTAEPVAAPVLAADGKD